MAQYLPTQFSPARIRSYLFRLPIFTRAIILIIVACYLATFFTDIDQYAELQPSLIMSGSRMSSFSWSSVQWS
ncbi:MAG: hypothetical protein INR71_13930 [Terriglobus roseus]|nr:hypothetical protein [Terriglobus roseus]